MAEMLFEFLHDNWIERTIVSGALAMRTP